MSYAEHSYPAGLAVPSAVGLRAKEIRRRLMNPPNAVAKMQLPAPALEDAPQPAIVFEGLSEQELRNPPMNMLAPCSWRFLLSLVICRTGIAQGDILSNDRSRPFVEARADAIALIWQHTQKSLQQVGRCFGRDHSTVLYNLRKRGASVKLVEIDTAARKASRAYGCTKEARKAAIDARRRRSALVHVAIRRGYAEGLMPEQIALLTGYQVKSIRTIASNLGLNKP